MPPPPPLRDDKKKNQPPAVAYRTLTACREHDVGRDRRRQGGCVRFLRKKKPLGSLAGGTFIFLRREKRAMG